MRFYAADEPDKLIRIDLNHRYTHIVREGDRVISFQKDLASAVSLKNTLVKEHMGTINELNAAYQHCMHNSTSHKMIDKYPTPALIAAAIRREQGIINKIKIVELIVRN